LETVGTETPAARATSLMVARPNGGDELTGADMVSPYRPEREKTDIDTVIEIVIDIGVDID
jgi:hypothetical protein